MPAKPDMACEVCAKRHETGNVMAPLQCRAKPPVQDVSRDAIYPTVQPSFYCHNDFVADPDAIKARKVLADATAKLDAQVAATQEKAAAAAAAPAQPELALEPQPADAPKPRARRAPAAKAK